jgi:hypothetical protein
VQNRQGWAALLLGVCAVGVTGTLVTWQPAAARAAVLAQATATPTLTPTVTPTPLAAAGWDRTDHPDGVRCYTNSLNGQFFGGCVVVTP